MAGQSIGKAKPPVVQPGTGNNIIINPNQRLNPLLECIRNVGKEFGDIVPDFQVGRTTGVLYLSLKYHRLHPEYIHLRIERLGHSYNLRILLIMCDVSEHQDPIRELTKVCLINNITVLVAWSYDEAGLYLSTYKQFEHKPPDLIKERVDKDYESILSTALTSINKVNKTDVETLRTSLGSFADIARTSSDRLQKLPGFGQVKVKRVKDAFEKPFRNKATSSVFSMGSQLQAFSEPQDLQQAPSQGTTTAPLQPAQDIAGPSHPARAPSPVWDIEMEAELDEPLTPPVPDSAKIDPPDGANSDKATLGRRRRSLSPIWDIELDLNPSEETPSDSENGQGPSAKKQKRTDDNAFGQLSTLLAEK